MKENILILMVGLPRSGKSTWAKKQPHPIVNPDSIRLALHGKRFIPEAEQFVWAVAHAMVKSLFHAGHNIVIFDATNTTKKRRAEWENSMWKTKYKFINTDENTCIDRAKNDMDLDLIPVIKRMAKQFEELTEEEKTDSIISV